MGAGEEKKYCFNVFGENPIHVYYLELKLNAKGIKVNALVMVPHR